MKTTETSSLDEIDTEPDETTERKKKKKLKAKRKSKAQDGMEDVDQEKPRVKKTKSKRSQSSDVDLEGLKENEEESSNVTLAKSSKKKSLKKAKAKLSETNNGEDETKETETVSRQKKVKKTKVKEDEADEKTEEKKVEKEKKEKVEEEKEEEEEEENNEDEKKEKEKEKEEMEKEMEKEEKKEKEKKKKAGKAKAKDDDDDDDEEEEDEEDEEDEDGGKKEKESEKNDNESASSDSQNLSKKKSKKPRSETKEDSTEPSNPPADQPIGPLRPEESNRAAVLLATDLTEPPKASTETRSEASSAAQSEATAFADDEKLKSAQNQSKQLVIESKSTQIEPHSQPAERNAPPSLTSNLRSDASSAGRSRIESSTVPGKISPRQKAPQTSQSNPIYSFLPLEFSLAIEGDYISVTPVVKDGVRMKLACVILLKGAASPNIAGLQRRINIMGQWITHDAPQLRLATADITTVRGIICMGREDLVYYGPTEQSIEATPPELPEIQARILEATPMSLELFLTASMECKVWCVAREPAMGMPSVEQVKDGTFRYVRNRASLFFQGLKSETKYDVWCHAETRRGAAAKELIQVHAETEPGSVFACLFNE